MTRDKQTKENSREMLSISEIRDLAKMVDRWKKETRSWEVDTTVHVEVGSSSETHYSFTYVGNVDHVRIKTIASHGYISEAFDEREQVSLGRYSTSRFDSGYLRPENREEWDALEETWKIARGKYNLDEEAERVAEEKKRILQEKLRQARVKTGVKEARKLLKKTF